MCTYAINRILFVRAAVGVLAALLSSCTVAQTEFAGKGGGHAAASVYRILCPDQNRAGTAFGHKSGQIITAAHIILGCDVKTVQVIAPSNDVTKVTSVISDPDLDVALLSPAVADFVKSPLSITNETNFAIGALIGTWGYPEGYNGKVPLLSVGYLAGVEEQDPGKGEKIGKWIVNGAFNLGNSGGPLIETKNATVIGIITSKLTPIPPKLDKKLNGLRKKGSPEGRVLAELIQYLRSQTQLMVGFASMTEDMKKFLKTHNIDP